MLTAQSWIEVKLETKIPPPAMPPPDSEARVAREREKKHKSLLEIHSVERDPSNACAFRIQFFSGSASSKAKAGLSKMKRFLSVSSNFEDFLKAKAVLCHSEEECQQWMLVLQRLVRNCWQRKMEQEILPEPEMYKRHAFVIKGHNDRMLLLSDAWFFNIAVEYKPIAIKSVQWAIPISSFDNVTQVNSAAQPEHALMIISFDAAEAKKQFDAHHRSNKSTELRNKLNDFMCGATGTATH